MDILILALLVILCYYLFTIYEKRRYYFDEHGVPYIPPLKAIGIMAAPIFRLKHFSETFTDIYNYNHEAKYVGVYDFFMKPFIFIRDPDLIKTVTVRHFDNFPDRPAAFDETVDPLFGGNLASLTGDKWREVRNLLSPAFTSSKMKAMFELMVECAENFNEHLAELAKRPEEAIAMKGLFRKYTTDVIATCAFGIKVNSLKDPDNEFYTLGLKAANFEGVAGLKFFFVRAAPALAKWLKIKFVNDNTAEFFTNIVKQTIDTRDEKGIRRPDMIQLMMDARGKTSDNVELNITQMTAQAFVFFFGGFETTSSHMCTMAHELVINPEVQAKLQAEIDQVLEENDGKATYEAINAMPYLDAVFYEAMRRHSLAPMLERVCKKSFELPAALPGGKPFLVESGMNVWVAVTPLYLDEKYYDNPEKFDPDRFVEKRLPSDFPANLGFGTGPRSCIGNRFAILETKILFFYMLSKFTLKPHAKTPTDFEYSKKDLAIVPKGGFWVTVEPRHSYNLASI